MLRRLARNAPRSNRTQKRQRGTCCLQTSRVPVQIQPLSRDTRILGCKTSAGTYFIQKLQCGNLGGLIHAQLGRRVDVVTLR